MTTARILWLVIVGGLFAPPGAFADRIVVGQPFPNLSFPALDGGEPRSIHDFHGTKLIAHVFASW